MCKYMHFAVCNRLNHTDSTRTNCRSDGPFRSCLLFVNIHDLMTSDRGGASERRGM